MGPLTGIRIVEFAGIGPAPFACMLLADMGAEVICLQRITPNSLGHTGGPADVLSRGRKCVSVDLKNPQAIEFVLKLIKSSDILIEGFRPKVMEKLGLGPKECHKHKPSLVYGRMTGWGQTGTLSHAAGHDLNYIALSGALHAIGRADSAPVPPLNLLGDFGGGSLYLVTGVLAALVEARQSGKGQVVDAAITDGVASLMGAIYGFMATGMWEDARQKNMLDGGAPYYGVFECSDGKWITLAAIEPQFYDLLAEKLGVDLGDSDILKRLDKSNWESRRQQIADIVKQRTRDEWTKLLEGSDVCFAPVLSMTEAPQHPHNQSRKTFVDKDGVVQPNVAPRFDRTPSCVGAPPETVTDSLLRELGYTAETIENLAKSQTIL